MFTADSAVSSCNVGAMVKDSHTAEHVPVIEALEKRGDSVARAVRKLELERAALRSLVLRAVADGIPVTEISKHSGISRKTIHEWLAQT